MSELSDLEERRVELQGEISRLSDFRPGSINVLVRPCGKPGCRCARSDDPGHGPNLRLTYKIAGKTYSESIPNVATRRKLQREIAEFRKFQQLSREFIEINARICRLRSGKGRDDGQ